MVTDTEILESPNLALLDSCLWDRMNSEVYERKVENEINCSLTFCMLLPAQRNLTFDSDEKYAIFARELQSALWLTVGFSKIYCEL